MNFAEISVFSYIFLYWTHIGYNIGCIKKKKCIRWVMDILLLTEVYCDFVRYRHPLLTIIILGLRVALV